MTLLAASGEAVIRLRDVGVSFGETDVLAGVSSDVAVGEYVTVTGRSGSGKSTLLNVIAGTIFPSTGQAVVGGFDLSRSSERVRAQRDVIGYLFQSAHLVSWMDAETNVALGMRYQRVPKAARKDRAREALDRVGLSHRMDHRPAALSGGERQRVALARAIARRPLVLLADEPTGNLDHDTGQQVITLLETVAGHTALVLVTHDPALAARGSRQWHVVDGQLHESAAAGSGVGHVG